MYQIGECWKEFYKELDPDRRRELYKTAVQESEDDGANALRRELMEQRYTDPRDSSHKVDNFLWNMVILPGYMRPMYFIKAIGEREIKGIIRDLSLEDAQEWDESKRAAAYWEYRNTAARYLTTCEGPCTPRTRRSWPRRQRIFTAWPFLYRLNTVWKKSWSSLSAR